MKQLQEVHRLPCESDIPGCVHYVLDDGTTMANGYRMDNFLADRLAKAKRLTITELAAEYWRAKAGPRIRAYQRDESGNIIDVPGIGWEYEHQVLLRFVTLPSYDEVAS